MRKNRKTGSKKFIIGITIVVVILLVVIPVGALGYAGIMPGVTPLLGVNKPVNLDVTYNAADYTAFETRTLSAVSGFGGAHVSQPGPNLALFGTDLIDTTVSQQELTAFLNKLPWSGSPLSNVQIKLDGNGIFEFSGNVNARYVQDLIKSIYPADHYNSWWQGFVIRRIGDLDNPALYVKAAIPSKNESLGPNSGQLSFKLLDIKLNKIDLTSHLNHKSLSIKTHPAGNLHYSISSLSISRGQVEYSGNFPAMFEVGGGDVGQICNNAYHGSSALLLSSVNGHIGATSKYCQ